MQMQWLRACPLPNVLFGHSSLGSTKNEDVEKENPDIGKWKLRNSEMRKIDQENEKTERKEKRFENNREKTCK
jgi:hypothetical protein